ncbi:MAG: O-antigen ligase family protein [Flavobacteriaceae bacterium]|nr:O-antigen ligase family protein [Flavobacteriaceae bacterium]
MRILLASIYPWIYVLLFLTIPFDNYVRILPNILMGFLIVTFPLIVEKAHFKKLKKGPTFLFALFCAYIVLNALFFGRLSEDFVLIKKILLAFGLVLLYIPIQDSEKIKRAIVFSSLAVILFSVINIFVIINTSEDIVLGFSRQVIEALLIDRLYLGFIAILSVLISCQSIQTKFHPNNKYLLVNIIVNVLFIFLLVSKIAVIILGVLFIIRQLYTSKKWLRFPLAFAVIAGLVLLFFSMTQTDGEEGEKQSFFESTLTWELRAEIWKCVEYIGNSEGFIVEGFGFHETKNKLVNCYEEHIESNYKREVFVDARYNSHNQFVDIYFNWGIVALGLFLCFVVVVFFKNRKEFIPTAYLIALISYCMVENVFHRQIGAYYVGFVLIATLIQYKQLENKEKKED